ncbi:DoxX family protein [Streptomyces sp. NPDC002514]|uniref:DoxX family protein n=1 Tax=unclassified Streptomyces TaxID=2593676 RepID=UPI00369919C5
MITAYVIVTVVTIVANAGIAVADLLRAGFVLANSAEVRLPRSWLPWLATAKAAGAAGLLLGLLGARPLGIAAAVGLVLFFLGAVAAHVRRRVYHNIAFPVGYLGLATASLVLATAR